MAVQPANNNVDIIFHEDRLFMAWRTAPTHFASSDTQLQVVSSTDNGPHWELETQLALGDDIREPRFLSLHGKLSLEFFEAGSNPIAFEPKALWRVERNGRGRWSEPIKSGDGGEVPWNLKVRGGVAWRSSYSGNHYDLGNVGAGPVYFGGVSETAFEFDRDGSIWIITRNEDGDASGFGSHLCHAQAGSLGIWNCPAQASPERYDSPQMFRHKCFATAMTFISWRDAISAGLMTKV